MNVWFGRWGQSEWEVEGYDPTDGTGMPKNACWISPQCRVGLRLLRGLGGKWAFTSRSL